MDFSQILGQFGQFFVGGGEMPPALAELRDWAAELPAHALKRWGVVLLSGIRCGCGGNCHRAAAGTCVICHKPTCLAHAFVSGDAYLSCHQCVHEAAVARGGAGPTHAGPRPTPGPSPDDLRKKYLKMLGLKEGASHEDIRAAFKKLAAKHHPDRARDAVKRAVAEKKFKEINEAFQWLTKEKAAA